MKPLASRFFIALLSLLALAGAVRADILDDASALQRQWESAILSVYAGEVSPESWTENVRLTRAFLPHLRSESAQRLWMNDLPDTPPTVLDQARWLGQRQALLQHVCALEMLERQQHEDIEGAREWRALIQLPKYADAVQGVLALQHGTGTQRDAVAQLLAREYLVWQTTLIREKTDALHRLIEQDRSTPEMLAARMGEVAARAAFPTSLLTLVDPASSVPTQVTANGDWRELAIVGKPAALLARFDPWASGIQQSLPNLLTAEEVTRRERLLIKLLKLIPMEYSAGVRDGEIVIPLEYREAETFTIQSRQILDEIRSPWERTKAEAFAKYGADLRDSIDKLEATIRRKGPAATVTEHCSHAMEILSDHFGVSLRRQGKASEVIAETLLDIRTLLGNSLAAAREGRWKDAESLRLEAYTTFDLEIESRTMPRDPALAIRVEKLFLDGTHDQIGIKAALDARHAGDTLAASYQAALNGMDECAALLQMALSPATAIYTTISVVTREGLEAVVILAALLAGLRGGENRRIRRNIGLGAAAALVASVATFIVSRMLIQSLSRYGETLEAVVSVLAVVVLLIVTNWVFHKMYWVEWNARLRTLTRSVNTDEQSTASTMAMIGVGFLTIYREGFETTLFLQSLLLEAGLRPVLIGLALGGGAVLLAGVVVFMVGAKLPYRRLLVVTGVLVVTVLVTFLGSTTRLFQTVGWLPIHPIPQLEIPSWMGTWLGFYPSWEGILIPPLGLAYVGGAWLYVKWRSSRTQNELEAQMATGSKPAGMQASASPSTLHSTVASR